MRKLHVLQQVPWTPFQALLVFIIPFVVLPIAILMWLTVIGEFYTPLEAYTDRLLAGDPQASFTLVLVDAAASYLLIGYYLRRYNLGWKALGIRRFSVIKTLVIIALMMIGFTLAIEVIFQLVQLLFPAFDPTQAQDNEFTNVAPEYGLYALLALVIFPPLVEEAIFRGFMFPAFSKRFGLIGGALISSLFFGLAHFQPNIIVYTFIIGLILCFLYTKTGSIIPGMILHMVNNYLAYKQL